MMMMMMMMVHMIVEICSHVHEILLVSRDHFHERHLPIQAAKFPTPPEAPVTNPHDSKGTSHDS